MHDTVHQCLCLPASKPSAGTLNHTTYDIYRRATYTRPYVTRGVKQWNAAAAETGELEWKVRGFIL